MYIAEVVPLTKTPLQKSQILSYFSAHDLPVGSLVLVPMGKRFQNAVVIEKHQLKNHKIEIKEAGYELRPIKKILTDFPVLTYQQIKLAIWLGEYYFASPGLFLKMMMPRKVNSKQLTANSKNKGQKLILVPTVSQIETLAKQYPKHDSIVLHSGLRAKQFNANWQKVASGQARTIIGTRLAAFAPFNRLKKIIIEDGTNSGHRSWDMFPHYRTLETAQKLAEIFEAKLIINGKLPSIESRFLSGQSGDVRRQKIKSEIIDMRQELRQDNYSIFSRQLHQAISDALKNKGQVILFINRRGMATFILCRDCGYVAKCQNCEAPITYHLIKKSEGLKPILICHHCGQTAEPPSLCPKCQGSRIKTFGTGTQRVEQEARRAFKDAKILRLDSDIAASSAEQEKIFEEFRQKKSDILIGTQMILSSNLPKVSLVAIISADTLMHLPDFRSNERLFQTMSALKELTRSKIFIQTYNPQAKIIEIAAGGDFKQFYENEIETRRILKYPPFSQLIKLVFRHHDPKIAGTQAKILAAKLTQQLKTSKPLHFLGQTATDVSKHKKINCPPTIQLRDLKCGGKILNEAIFEITDAVPAFIAKQKGRYIWQIIIKAKPYWLAKGDERENLLFRRNKILMSVPSNWEIEVDPETLL